MDRTEADLARVLNTGPFHQALRAALSVRGLPLQRVQHHLAHRGIKVGVTSLCYWQQGARRPRRPESLRAVRALEEVLELPAQSLIRLLGTDGRPPAPPGRAHRGPAEVTGEAGRLLGAAPHGALESLALQERVRIGGDRRLLGRDAQHVVRARRDGVDRFLAVHRGEAGCDPDLMEIGALENCRPGRIRRDGSAGVLVAELLFDTALRTGETYVLGYGVEDGTGGPSDACVRRFGDRGGQYLLQVRFDRGALPLRCHRFARAPDGTPRGARTELAVSGRHRTVHLLEQAVRPGTVGIAWEWG
ncbi:hypothetical protein [Streptomyces genisteinicus]|uniref:XRE family transcriptional regulator n=1 Tax=Streptomyces genisteinicus TaxID=2768068 RepID=A0A7H0HQC2_9ACTN|nr:hypothetical protein [Streptomyces genisteinicus]QNP62738.1 hypothetical protein IAG43_07155 [Streptomyces genisteinicus]